MRFFPVLTAIGLSLWAVTAVAQAAPPAKVTICHGVGGTSLTPVSIPPQTVINGHAGRHPRDIIPPFEYGSGLRFAGQNWNQQGILTWLNRCVPWTPPEPPEPPQPPPPRPVPPPAPLPGLPVFNAQPVTFCLAADTGYVVRTERPLATARLVVGSPSSIVPPFAFSVNGRTYAYPGYNWGVSGQATWNAGCITPGTPGPGGGSPGGAAAAARVAVTITPSTYRPRPGAVVRFTVRGAAGGSENAVDPRMCARVPALMTVVSVVGGARARQTVCWLSGVSARGASVRYFTARVSPLAAGIALNARAAIDARNTRPARSLTTLYPVERAVPVTG